MSIYNSCLNGGITQSCIDPCEVTKKGNVTGLLLSRVNLLLPSDLAEIAAEYALGNIRMFLESNGNKDGSATVGKGYGEVIEEPTGYEHSITSEFKFSETQFQSFKDLSQSPKGWYFYYLTPGKIWETGVEASYTAIDKVPADIKGRVTVDVVAKWASVYGMGAVPYDLNKADLAAICVGN